MDIQDFQKDRIIRQLLLIEDHLNATIEDIHNKPICVACLTDKHFPLVESLCIECIEGVCYISYLKETCEEIIKTIGELREAIYNELSLEKIKEFAERIRSLRKKLQKKEVEIE